MNNKKALIVVDIQKDFCTGGSLAVKQGEMIIPTVNQLMPHFDLVVATKDWHPADHTSFAINHPGRQVGEVIQLGDLPQILWPSHCVQGTPGSDFFPGLETHLFTKIFYKGTDSNLDSYSAFYDNAHLRSTGLTEYLREQGVDTVYLTGLATDYCVKYSALDALHGKFNVVVFEDACKGVELTPGDIAAAYAEMRAQGIQIMLSQQFLQNF